jgi:hypothetical protein
VSPVSEQLDALTHIASRLTLQPDLDWAYTNRWAQRLTVAALLTEVRR